MSNQTTVLYDAPGPRARRYTTIASVLLGVLVFAGIYYLIYLPLAKQGQFTLAKWGPLINPGDEVFTLVWDRIAAGLLATLKAAALALIFSLVAGTLLAVIRMLTKTARSRRYPTVPFAGLLRANNVFLSALTRVSIEIFRGLPVLVTIFFAWRISGISNPLWPLVIGLTIYNGVVIAEILRSGMEGLPSGQREAADSLGLSPLQAIRLVQLPQAFRVMLPALISQLVVILKDTSLGFIITYEDTLAIAQQIIQVLKNPIQVYTVIGIIFILVNYSLSKLAGYVQRRMSSKGAGVAPPAAATDAAVAVMRTPAEIETSSEQKALD